MEKLEIDLKELEGTGIADAESLINTLKQAAGLKKEAGKVEEFKNDLMEEIKSLRAEIGANIVAARNETEAAEVEELQKDALAKAFKTETDPAKKAAIAAKLEETYSGTALDVLTGSTLKNVLMAPVSKSAPNKAEVDEIRKLHDSVIAATALLGGVEKVKTLDKAKMDLNIFNHVVDVYKEYGEFDPHLCETYRKAQADTWDTTADVEWIPVNLSRDYVESVWMAVELPQLFKRNTMTSPTFKLPYVGGRARAALMAETTTAADFNTQQALTSQRTSSDVTFTARKLGVQQGYSDEIEQDAIVPTTELIMASIRDALAASIEDCTLNGSRTANNLDNAVGGSEKWVLGTQSSALGRDAWNGVRVGTQTACKVDADGSLTAETLRTARKKMGRYGKKPSELIWVISINTLMDVLNLPEVITVDKYGPNATIVQGEIGKIDNIRIVVSEFVYTDLATTGVYTGAGNTRTAMYLIWLPAWNYGDRRLLRIEQDRSIVAQHNIVVGSMRLDFEDLQGSETTEAWIYDLAA